LECEISVVKRKVQGVVQCARCKVRHNLFFKTNNNNVKVRTNINLTAINPKFTFTFTSHIYIVISHFRFIN